MVCQYTCNLQLPVLNMDLKLILRFVLDHLVQRSWNPAWVEKFNWILHKYRRCIKLSANFVHKIRHEVILYISSYNRNTIRYLIGTLDFAAPNDYHQRWVNSQSPTVGLSDSFYSLFPAVYRDITLLPYSDCTRYGACWTHWKHVDVRSHRNCLRDLLYSRVPCDCIDAETVWPLHVVLDA